MTFKSQTLTLPSVPVDKKIFGVLYEHSPQLTSFKWPFTSLTIAFLDKSIFDKQTQKYDDHYYLLGIFGKIYFFHNKYIIHLPQRLIIPLPQHVISRFSLSSVHAQSITESGRSNALVIAIYPFGCILNTIYFPFPTIPKFEATLTANLIGSMRENFTDIPQRSDLKAA
jgi:hypothetical protein